MATKIKFPRGPFFDPDVENPELLDREQIGTEDLLPVKGNTPFGRYDQDPKFRRHAKKFALWAARRLGWPEMSIEIDERDLYSALEEAIDEFSRLVGNQNIEDNLEAILGSDADQDLTGRWVSSQGGGQQIEISKDYGNPNAGAAGGNVNWYKGFIELEVGRQVYHKSEIKFSQETSKGEFDFVPVDEEIVISRVFHEDVPSSVFGYYGSGGGYGQTSRGIGFSDYGGGGGYGGGYNSVGGASHDITSSPEFTLYPLYDSTLAIQDYELHEDIFESDYSFEIIGDKIKVFPIPQTRHRLWVEFIFDDEALGVEVVGDSTARADIDASIENVVSDYSDAPYDFIPFRFINAPGKRWIFKYGLEIARHKLGTVRSKFSDTPSPQDTFQLDGQDLKQEATSAMERLVDNLNEQLDSLSKEERMRRKADMAENLSKYLSKVPMLIYRDN